MKPPTPDQIREAREAAGLTQAASAALIYVTDRAWRRYEAGDHEMHPALFELYLIKIKK